MLLDLFVVFNVASEFDIIFEGGVVVIVVILCSLTEFFVSVNTTNFDPSHHGPVDKMMKSGSGRASADNASHHLPAYTCLPRLLTVQGELLHIILLPRVH